MDPRPVVDVLLCHGADFVVVGSGARFLLGDDVVPADVDVAISDSPANRLAVVDALFELDGYVVTEERLQRLTHATVLPWQWSSNAVTIYGPVDMIVQFIDSTGYEEHHACPLKRSVPEERSDSGSARRCPPDRPALRLPRRV